MMRNISRRKKRELFWRYVFVMPQLVLYLGLTLVPFIVALPLLFTDRIDYSDVDVDYVGFANFTKVFTDFSVRQDYWPALGRNAVFFAMPNPQDVNFIPQYSITDDIITCNQVTQ